MNREDFRNNIIANGWRLDEEIKIVFGDSKVRWTSFVWPKKNDELSYKPPVLKLEDFI